MNRVYQSQDRVESAIGKKSFPERYQLLTDTYYGTGLFEGGRGLRRHPRESIENYHDRQALAYYWNYTAPIVNAFVSPIYKDDIRREFTTTDVFLAFLNDCDRAGTNYQDFCKSAALHAKLYGAAYVIVDNSAEMDPDKAGALEHRNLPFLKLVCPQQVLDWEIDKYGRITEFAYEETINIGAGKQTGVNHIWTQDTWEITAGDMNRSGTHTIGRVPVVQWLARNTNKTMIKPPSEYLGVAQSNYFLYQLCSWHTQILRDQAFSILTLPDDGSGEITVGTNNALTYPSDAAHTPSFIAPSAAPADMLTSQMDRTIKEIFRMSGLESVIGIQADRTRSGVAKQWDFERTNKALADFSVRCENADKAIIGLYEKWANEDTQYTCIYPRDFKINDVTAALSDAAAALDLGFDSKTYKQEVLKKVLAAYLPNLAPEIYDKVISEVAEALDHNVMEKTFDMVNVAVDADEAE